MKRLILLIVMLAFATFAIFPSVFPSKVFHGGVVMSWYDLPPGFPIMELFETSFRQLGPYAPNEIIGVSLGPPGIAPLITLMLPLILAAALRRRTQKSET